MIEYENGEEKDGYKIEVKFDDGKDGVVDFSILSELSLDERGQLAAKILLSLEEPSEEEVEKLWIAEAELRLQEYREGKVKGIPAEEIFQKAIKDIS